MIDDKYLWKKKELLNAIEYALNEGSIDIEQYDYLVNAIRDGCAVINLGEGIFVVVVEKTQ